MKTLELCRVHDQAVKARVALPVHSGKDPLALLLEAAEDLCVLHESDDLQRIAASDIAPFVLPRLAELLDPENHELWQVLSLEGKENVGEHTIRHWLAKRAWPTNGSHTLEAAVLAVKLDEVAREAARNGEGIELRWRTS